MEQKPLFRNHYHEYKRDLDYVTQWIDQSVFCAKLEDPNLDEAAFRQWLRENSQPEGLFPINNPKMRVIQKNENNDRVKNELTFMDYLRQLQRDDLRFAPTFTTYRPEHKQMAVESKFLTVGMNNRKVAKKQKFKAKEQGDHVLEDYYQNLQLMLKILNNSSSGAHATAGNILYNQTGHSTLTSICRSTTSLANSTNEKFLGGRRHYFNAEVTINDIIAVLTWRNVNETMEVVYKYNLKPIDHDLLLSVIKRSTDLYWRSPIEFKKIEEFVRKLSVEQCTAYLYTSDFYHLREFNEPFVRQWLTDLITVDGIAELPVEEAEQWVKLMDSDLACLIAIYCADVCNGKSVETRMRENPETIPYIGAVIKRTLTQFECYRDLIRAFWVTDAMPLSTAHVPNMMRGVVLGSDTDSSLFTLDEWVVWYRGSIIADPLSDRLVCTVVYIVSQHIAHILGMMTGFLNISVEKRPLIAMKNEFYFSTFITTSLGKHYCAKAKAQEGILFKPGKEEKEIKGVVFKHSKVPGHITRELHQVLDKYMDYGSKGETFSVMDYLYTLAKLEFEIYNSIKRGEPIYLQTGQIKVKEAYKNENSLYKKAYLFWDDVFGEKYGFAPEPPYDIVKIVTGVDTKARMETWLATWEDQHLADKYRNWMNEHNDSKPIKTFYIPQAIAQSKGIPSELYNVMEPRKLVYTIVAPYYVFMEVFHVFMRDKNIAKLISDDFPEWEIPESLDLGAGGGDYVYDDDDGMGDDFYEED